LDIEKEEHRFCHNPMALKRRKKRGGFSYPDLKVGAIQSFLIELEGFEMTSCLLEIGYSLLNIGY